ncbi:MAG: hypothetical protein K8H88_17350, partial [Sandaracinaceae bacterium]|nr:hypothetical protein [Sandaracinaceae bacterium]
AVAQALLGEPELVLLDEPTGGLDPHLVVEMREILRSQRGLRTIIVSSHLLADLEAVCDHVAFLERGRSVRAGSIESLTRRSHLVRVRLEEAIDGEEDLRGALTPWKLHFNGMEILIELDEESSAAQANERILRALFDRDARVLELRLGESLEDAYLAAREQARSP